MTLLQREKKKMIKKRQEKSKNAKESKRDRTGRGTPGETHTSIYTNIYIQLLKKKGDRLDVASYHHDYYLTDTNEFSPLRV